MGNLSHMFHYLLPHGLTRTPQAKTNTSPNQQGDSGLLATKFRKFFRLLRRRRTVFTLDNPPSETQYYLPTELFLHIFAFLDAVDLLECRSVCKHLKAVIDESPKLQYTIELYATGYLDNRLCSMEGTTARLNALKKETQFWRNPKGTWHLTDFPWSVTFEDLSNTSWHDNLWVRSQKFAGASENKWNALQCVLFEPMQSGPPIAESWQLTFPFSFVCASADPPESVVFLLDVETGDNGDSENYVLYKVSALDGTVLSKTILPFEGPSTRVWEVPELNAKGDSASIIRLSGLDDTNTMNVHITLLRLSDLSRVAAMNLSVVGHHLVTPQHLDDKCLLMHFMKGGEFKTEVYAPVATAEGSLELVHVVTLHYPAAHPSFVTEQSGSITGTSGGGLMTRATPARPYVRSTVNPLVFLFRYYYLHDGTLNRIVHIFPFATIDSFVSTYKMTRKFRHMSWNEWGPRNSRCFLDNVASITGSYGSQMLLSDYTVLDFNARSIARDLRRMGKALPVKTRTAMAKRFLSRRDPQEEDVQMPEGDRIVRKPTVLQKGGIITEDIVTYLPYRESKLNWTGPNPVLLFGGEVWVACTYEVNDEGGVNYKCYMLGQ